MSEITGNDVVSSDFLKVLLTLKTNIMKSTNVSMIGKVERIDNDKYIVTDINNSKLKISCSKVKNLTVEKDDIVVVLFTDGDNRVNLSRIAKNEIVQNTETTILHSLDYGIIIAIITGQTVDINALQDAINVNTKAIEANTKAITSLEKQLSGIDLPFNKGQGIVLNANNARYKLYGDSQSSNIFWEITKNGQTDYIYAQPAVPHIETVATNASWNTTSHTHTTGVVDPALGFPRFLVFSSKAKSSPNNEQSMRMYPLDFLKKFDEVEMDCRDAWAGFKDIKLTYTSNKYTLHFKIRGQSGWSDVNTLNIYLVW